MPPTRASLTLKDRIDQELANLEARTTELRIALKVLHEFGAEEVATEGDDETKRIILKPSEDVPEAVKSRLPESAGRASKVADKALELDRN